VTPDAALRYWRWNLEKIDPTLLAAALELIRTGDQTWDIGANVGLFSFAAAACAGPSGRVVAIEPDTQLVELLRRSARLQSASQSSVDVLPVAVSDRAGLAEFLIAARGRSSSHLAGTGYSETGGTRAKQLVPTITLDWLLEQYGPPAVVKIDAEGAEIHALLGAERLLSVARPRLLVEVAGENAPAVTSILKRHHYALFDADVPSHRRGRLDQAVWNTVAFPES
jgi:FkbM family methyltransferase